MARNHGRGSGIGLGAAAIAIGLYSYGAKAADFGKDGGVADLEERVAELESSTARKGNRKVKLTISGIIHKGLLSHNNDDLPGANKLSIYDGSTDPSRVRIEGALGVNGLAFQRLVAAALPGHGPLARRQGAGGDRFCVLAGRRVQQPEPRRGHAAGAARRVVSGPLGTLRQRDRQEQGLTPYGQLDGHDLRPIDRHPAGCDRHRSHQRPSGLGGVAPVAALLEVPRHGHGGRGVWGRVRLLAGEGFESALAVVEGFVFLALVAGDELLRTDHGYNAANNAIQYWAERSGARVIVAVPAFQHSQTFGQRASSQTVCRLWDRKISLIS